MLDSTTAWRGVSATLPPYTASRRMLTLADRRNDVNQVTDDAAPEAQVRD
jgi:hypothetical protein